MEKGTKNRCAKMNANSALKCHGHVSEEKVGRRVNRSRYLEDKPMKSGSAMKKLRALATGNAHLMKQKAIPNEGESGCVKREIILQ